MVAKTEYREKGVFVVVVYLFVVFKRRSEHL